MREAEVMLNEYAALLSENDTLQGHVALMLDWTPPDEVGALQSENDALKEQLRRCDNALDMSRAHVQEFLDNDNEYTNVLQAEAKKRGQGIADLFDAKEVADETGMDEQYEMAWNTLRALLAEENE
jgi:hypothetical protein